MEKFTTFKELKVELSARGHRFNSTGDSEVLLHAFAEWGVDALLRFNGMFAFAIWDNRERKLTIARDRFGVKPVYYAEDRKRGLVRFGNQSFSRLPRLFVSRIDAEGLTEYLSFQNFFTDRTLFEEARLLPAGCYIQIDMGRSAGMSIPSAAIGISNFEEPEGRIERRPTRLKSLDRLFRQAVNRQLVSDVDVGSYLSGGIDSGLDHGACGGTITLYANLHGRLRS